MPALFSIHFTSHFQRDLERLPPKDQTRVLEGIKILESRPKGLYPHIKKLKGKGVGQWRLEVWPYRVRYDVVGRDVILYRVRHRKEIYRE